MTIAPIQPTFRSFPHSGDFENESRSVLARLRTAFSELFAATPGGVRRAVDVQKMFGVDNKTSWRLFKLATASDPLTVGMHVPGRPSIRRALDAAEKHTVPAPTIQAVLDAYEAFEQLVDRYAGDRTTFDSMVSAYGDDDAAQTDLMHRRAAYRANSHLLGIRSDAQMITHVLFPNHDEPEMLDVAVLQGSYGLRRLRRHVSWPVATASVSHTGGELIPKAANPLTDDDPDRIGLISEFSTHPKSELRVRPGQTGRLNIDLIGDSVGIPSTSTCLFGHVVRAMAPWYRTPADEDLRLILHVITPTEVLLSNIVVHTATFGLQNPGTRFGIHVRQQPNGASEAHPSIDLPMRERAACVGQGLAALHTPELPRYTEMMRRSFDRLALDPEAFTTYRLRVEFPPMLSTALCEFRLPERPEAGPRTP
jgi:hypothetical protein